ATARPQIPESLNDRAADIWEPLLVLADLAGGGWPVRAREAAVSLSGSAQESNPIASLLLDLFMAFGNRKAQRLFTSTLLADLCALGSRPWMELKPGKELTEIWLSQRLRPYGI